jgi:hypothetical protein
VKVLAIKSAIYLAFCSMAVASAHAQIAGVPSDRAIKDAMQKSTDSRMKRSDKKSQKDVDAASAAPLPAPVRPRSGEVPTPSATGYPDPCDVNQYLPQCVKK